ncbi:MAG: hypothetical protein ABEJ47_04960 [Halorhabdus sp.]
MAPNEVVLLSSPDEDLLSSLTTALRDRWPVRTATTSQETETSLDDTVAVVILDAMLSLSSADLAAMIDEESSHAQILRFGGSDDPVTGIVDAAIPRNVDEDTVRVTVERLQTRARYDRLLSQFYSLARSRGELAEETATSETKLDGSTRDLDELKRELDEVATRLDDEDAFDVALEE